ncbi:MAG: hypothetical protein JO197_17840 [Acidobacteria bacterium]|nr:hypothetical protein [Acidobacteriota bacterium]MBV9478967.1 hypothetical protein [Acidobacteriota bacterium]
MASDLFKPIVNERTRAPNFFNGRLLTGEAMTDEQRAQRTARELLGQAIGDGVVYGLEVSIATASNTLTRPVVTIESGLAIDRRGELLLLANDVDVQLVRPDDPVPDVAKIFRTCTPISSGTYIANAGVYLLTISPIRTGNGLAQVSGLGDTPRGCNVKDVIDAVEFRLLELPVPAATLGDVNHLRNIVAYQCFGAAHLLDVTKDPFAADAEPRTLLDDVTALTECDVPLALLYWTATGGIRWLDLWSVRRRVTHMRAASQSVLDGVLDDVRVAVAEAMIQQFQEHIAAQLAVSGNPASLTATDIFMYLPPAGILPANITGHAGFEPSQFFGGLTTLGPRFTEGARVEQLFAEAVRYPPIRLADKELIRLYNIRENRQAIDGSFPVAPAVVFTNGHVPTRAGAHFDLAHWGYASYA